ncbi:MAG: S8 family peptidase, partial [Pseudomonadota bacterium]
LAGRVAAGFTAISDGRGSSDCNGHGTHVAGTVAGTTWGVAKNATIYPVRVLGCNGSGSNSGVIAGMDWIAANHVKPAVANMSLGGGASAATDNAVTNMRNAGVTVVVAAGNENQNACNVSPARSANAITVGSTTSSDVRSSFSNFGTCVDIFAPGSSITSAWYNSNSATRTISGTSMASPHVAGIAALYLSVNPNATPAQVENAIYSAASTGKLSGINSGSPNLLAYSVFGNGGGNPPPSGPTALSNGVAETGLSGSTGSEQFFTLDVPAGATNLVFQIAGGSGDADLYVRRGSEPTTNSYDCRPYLNGNAEACSFANPGSGIWHVMIRGYQAYSGVSLVGSFAEPSNDPCTNCDQYTGSLNGTGDADIQPNGNWYFAASSGTHNGYLRGPSNADFDLELYRWNGGGWSRVDTSTSASSDEDISYSGTRGYYYWRVLSYSGSGSYDLWLDTP